MFFPNTSKEIRLLPSSIYIEITNPFYKLIQYNKYREENQLVGVGSHFSRQWDGELKKLGIFSLIDMKFVYIKKTLIELLVVCFRLYVI